MNLNVPLPLDQFFEDRDQSDLHHPVGLNHPDHSSLSSLSCHLFCNRTSDDHICYHDQRYRPDQHHQEANTYAYKGGSSSYEIKEKVHETSALKLNMWKKENDHDHCQEIEPEKNNPVKWISSKMRLMQKMKSNRDHVALEITINSATTKVENQKLQSSSSSFETHFNSNKISSYNYNNNPIRVCSDCNTTKTPLWRSGPIGPKSLCNACGIRQRKARQAMAAATNSRAMASYQSPAMKIKLQKKKDKARDTNVHATLSKKRYKIASTTSPSNGQKLGFEDFLINLSKKLAFHRVFPEEEKDAAMLLMALSCGLIHG